MNEREAFEEKMRIVFGESVMLRRFEAFDGSSLNDEYRNVCVNQCWIFYQALASQAQQSQWISVEERLPELDKEVIGVFFDGTMMCRRLCAYTEDGWYSYDDRIWKPVLYWAELDVLPPALEGE